MPSGAIKTEQLPEPAPIRVPYGSEAITLTLPAGTILLQPNDPQSQMTPDRYRRLPTDGLSRTDPDLSLPILVVAEKTRLCAYPDYLPITVAVINDIDEQTCRLIGVEKWGIPDVEKLLAGPVGRIAWLENASLLVRQQSY